jgi:hypothetical protein
MKPKTFQMLNKYYTFEYPFYSGRSVSCKICKESQWFTGMELKYDADNGWLKIFNHAARCQAAIELQDILSRALAAKSCWIIPQFPSRKGL